MKRILTLMLFATTCVVGHAQAPTHIPQGMKLVWSDEFNSQKLDLSKWSTNYYSTFDFAAKTNFKDFKSNNLPQPVMRFTDSTIILFTNSELPKKAYWNASGRKISSIQTYDWNSNKNYMGDKFVGGYIEARIKRSAAPNSEMVNGAFWLDSPGPDMKYYIEDGNEALGAKGIRPTGQIFEIDLCENLNTEFVLHGNTDKNGKFMGNMGHHIVKGKFTDRWVTHGILWSPSGLKFYIDGVLEKEWCNPSDIKSPNHFMNLYLGMYGKGGEAKMEVDYVRFYQWNTSADNELPNGDFEYNGQLFPWEGNGEISKTSVKNGTYSLTVKPGHTVYQYLYLDHSKDYKISFAAIGDSALKVDVENIQLVSGTVENNVNHSFSLKSKYSNYKMDFKTGVEKLDHKKTVRIAVSNVGSKPINIDNIKIYK